MSTDVQTDGFAGIVFDRYADNDFKYAAIDWRDKNFILTSEGTALSCSVGCYSLSAFGTATDGDRSSSFNYAGGYTNDLTDKSAADYFGIGDMLKETERQIVANPIDGNFVGDQQHIML